MNKAIYALFLICFISQVNAQTANQTCTISQQCIEHVNGKCSNPTNINNPIINFYEPAIVSDFDD